MMAIVHPLAEELGGLVETGPLRLEGDDKSKDNSWLWVAGIIVAVGVIAWLTR